MLNVFNILLLNKNSILFTSCVKISEQYLGYHAKYSLFNLKGSKLKVTKYRNLCLNLPFSEAIFISNSEQWQTLFCKTHGGSDFRLIDDPAIKLSSVVQCLMFVFGWANHGPNRDFH